MEKLFLLDAYALIYRAYYAFIKNPRINSKGLNTSAILGFVNTLEEVLTKEQPSHIGIAFDPSGPTFRHEAYEQYKAQREETPEGIRTAVPYIKDIIRAYRIPILEIPGYEADDVIGTLARQADARGVDTFMMTPDKDYGQLVTDHVKMYRPKYGDKEFEVLGVEEVKEKYGLTSPTQVIDMLGLMGDSADNIPGCPGVGEKTATKLIQQFGSIENLLAGTDQLKGALKTKIENNKEQIEFSKFLATIKTDVPIELDMEQLKKEEPDEEKLRSLFEELEFRTLLDRKFKKENPQPAQDLFQGTLFADFTADSPEYSKNSSLTKYNKADFDYQLIDTEEKRKKIIDLFLTNDFLSLDTETTGTDPISAKLVGLSFSIRENQAFYVPIPQNDEEAQKIVNEFKPIYENENILKIGQNIKYDLLVLQNYGVELKGKIFDTMIAHYLLQPELHHGMDYMAEVYLNYQTIHIEELIGKGKNQKNMADLPPTAVYEYACEDADVTLKLKNILEPQLKENDCDRLFWEIEMPLMPVLAYMERNGVCIDREGLKETSRLYTEEMNRIEQEIHELAGTDFNIASPKQVGEVLFDRLKIVDKPKKTKTGQYVTSEEVLESLRTKHPVVEKILEHRGLKKLLGTYIDALPKLVNPETGHIHTSFNQTITTTGRLSSSNPNLQNIPVRNEYGKEIRKAFIPEEGCLFFSADYSQIELRIMAHLSGDEHMIEAFRNGYDIHAATAAKIFKKSLEEVTKEERSKAKTANFGIIYGITAFGLAERMGVSRTEAKELIEGYFQTYPKVKEYMNRSIEMAREKGYTETVYHRKCHLRDINSHNAVVRGYAERNAINSPIQGSAADIIKIAMIRIYHRFREEQLRSKMILQVHDELNFSVYPEEKEKVQQIVIEEMEHAYSMQVPLEADYGWGKNWLEAH
ncbi:DNA polymerase I [Bacteroides eggerthii]|uniref:DNA polymerase I n=1 Tax=Bacteroides eggerthii TaxID=28111 RepID=A0ABT7U871_9BACE|nr:DNA polymerase I [Bacteroides eggerthii]